MMNAQGYDPQNLQALATFLAYGEVEGIKFDMKRYSEWGDAPKNASCGTVGCAVGWASMIWPKPLGRGFYNWSIQMFIREDDPHDIHSTWAWCFSGDWSLDDNSRLGAAQRIQYFLDNEGRLPAWDYTEDGVDIYSDTIVKRDQEAIPRPSSSIIAELIDRIKREPRYTEVVK